MNVFEFFTHRPDELRVSVQGSSYHNNGSCYKCNNCGKGLTGRRVSCPAPGYLACGSDCGRKLSQVDHRTQKNSMGYTKIR